MEEILNFEFITFVLFLKIPLLFHMMQLYFDGFIKIQIRANKNVNQINIDYVNAFFGRKRAEAKNINNINMMLQLHLHSHTCDFSINRPKVKRFKNEKY